MLQETSKIRMEGKFFDAKDAAVRVLTHALHDGLEVPEGIRCSTLSGPAHGGRSPRRSRMPASAPCAAATLGAARG